MSEINLQSSRKLTVLYGSQTGTAQDVAEQIGRDALRYHFSVTVNALDNYNIVSVWLLRPSSFKEICKLCFFIVILSDVYLLCCV